MVDILQNKSLPFDTSVLFFFKMRYTNNSSIDLCYCQQEEQKPKVVHVHTAHEDRSSKNTAETLSMLQLLLGLAADHISVSCTAANTSDRRFITCCNKIIFLEIIRLCSVHTVAFKNNRERGWKMLAP